MAKLADRITPEELLRVVMRGTRKDEIIKSYKTSDQELAMLLLPMFRSGEMTKDQFNDFFKGLSVSAAKTAEPAPSEQPSPAAAAAADEEAPPKERSTLSRIISRKSTAAATGQEPETPHISDSGVFRTVAPAAAPRETGPREQAPPSAEAEASNAPAAPDPAQDREAPVGELKGLLHQALSRLDAIERRLSQIEMKLAAR
jgi:hypothetical protein